MVDRGGRAEADRQRDLADGRRIAPGAERSGDVVKDLQLAIRVVPGHSRLPMTVAASMIPNGCSMSRLAARLGAARRSAAWLERLPPLQGVDVLVTGGDHARSELL